MTSVPEQDLALFADHSILPDSYLKLKPCQLGTIAHVQGTSPAWLVSSLIENAIIGTATTTNRDINKKIPNRSHVVYISFTNTKSVVVKNCKRNGLSLDTDKNFTFHDCLTDLFTKHIKDTSKSKEAVQKFFGDLRTAIENISHELTLIILENPELLLAATDFDSNSLIYFILSLQTISNSVFVIINAEPSLIDFDSVLTTEVVPKVADFFVKLLHKSSINVNLLPLATGRAEDITGCLTISKGAVPSPTAVAENEFIYNVTKEGSVKLFFR